MLNKFGVAFLLLFFLLAILSGQIWGLIWMVFVLYMVNLFFAYLRRKHKANQSQSAAMNMGPFKGSEKKKKGKPVPEHLKKKLATRRFATST